MSDKSTVLIPGSFDPLTLGHYDVVMRARALFGRIYVVSFVNSEKSGFFTPDERLEILRSAFSDFPEIVTDISSGVLPHQFHFRKRAFEIRKISGRFCPGKRAGYRPRDHEKERTQ